MVEKMREYKIPFVGLKNGLHHYNYEITDIFFAVYKDSLVKKGNVFVDIAFDKKDRLFKLEFDISGRVECECDRCGETFMLPIHEQYIVFVKTGNAEEVDVDEDDIIWIKETDSMLDVSKLIYDFINLSIPIMKIHPDKKNGEPGCPPEILMMLGIKKNQEELKDPRWDQLNKLNKN